MARVVASLQEMPHIDEILVWNNTPEETLDLPGALVFRAPKNFGCFPRFAVATVAKNDLLWFQDDDLLLSPTQFQTIADSHARAPDRIHGAFGCNVGPDRTYSSDLVYGEVDMVLGRAFMCSKALLAFALSPPAVPTMPREDDIHFSLQCRRRHVAVDIGPVIDLGSRDEHANFLKPGHLESRHAAGATCLSYAEAHPSEAELRRQLLAVETELAQAREQLSSRSVRAVQAMVRRARALRARLP